MPNVLSRPVHGLLLILLALFGFNAPSVAQTGTIAGVVIDAETGETLIGVNVVIQGTAIGAATNLDGAFRISNVEPGIYTITASYIGFDPITVTDVEVTAGETTRLDLTMAAEAVTIGEVTVEARLIRNNEAALLKYRQKAAAVSDAISAETISRSGSSDAADALEKVTGASIVGGKYVVVRGLGGRYANAQLNSVEMPSADPNRKSVQFDLFPSNLLDNIVITKTFTPDKPGNFSGGLVNINTRDFPDEFIFQFSASVGWNTRSSFNDNVLSYDGGDTDWLGYDDGTRILPGTLHTLNQSQDYPNRHAVQRDADVAAQAEEITDGFNTTLAPTTRAVPLNQRFSLSLGNQVQVGGNPLGFIFGGTYANAASFYEDGETGRYGVSSAGGTLRPERLLADQRSVREVTIGGLANLTYRLGRLNEIGLNALYTRNGENETRLQVGQDDEVGTIVLDGEPDVLLYQRALLYQERELYSLQLRGEHSLPALSNLGVAWRGALSETVQDEPDRRFINNTERRRQGRDPLIIFTGSGLSDPRRIFRKTSEKSVNGQLDLTLPLSDLLGIRFGELKVGSAYRRTERTSDERLYTIDISTGIPFPGTTSADPEAIAAYFSDRNTGIIDTVATSQGDAYVAGHLYRLDPNLGNNYVGALGVAVGYAMAEFPLLSPRLRVIGGVRFETTDLYIDTEVPFNAGRSYEIMDGDTVDAAINEVDALWSANIVYQVLDNMNVRAAATQTLARPLFREIAPAQFYDTDRGALVVGNPQLERTLINNYDVRWEWFRRPGEIFAVSAFYKYLRGPIERIFLDPTNDIQSFTNVPSGEVFGLELEARTRLGFLTSVLQNVSFGANVTFTESSVDLSAGEALTRRANGLSTNRDLQGQSPYLLNLNLSYENYERGTSAGLFFNIFGERLSTASPGVVPDIYEQPQPTLDVTFSQQVMQDFRIKLSGENLLNSAYEEAYVLGSQQAIYQRYNRGVSFSLGITYSPTFGGHGAPLPTPDFEDRN